jgi:uncharacterized protein YbjT (DUF2867 family)
VRVAIAGGTGLTGRHVADLLRRSGHDAAVISRSAGVDILTGTGLAEALAGAQAVIDVTNAPAAAADADQTRAFFATITRQLLAAGQKAGVRHHVVLSIVGIDRVQGNAHYAGKRVQEKVALDGPVPVTIVRATQFHEFAGMVVSWTRQGDTAAIAPLLVQPVAVADVADVLAEAATGPPGGEMISVAGPEPQDLVDMARRTLAARGESIKLVPTWRGPFSAEMAGEVLLPGPEARLAATTFDEWLASQAAEPAR